MPRGSKRKQAPAVAGEVPPSPASSPVLLASGPSQVEKKQRAQTKIATSSPHTRNTLAPEDELGLSQPEAAASVLGGFVYHNKHQFPTFCNPNETLRQGRFYFRNVDIATDLQFNVKEWKNPSTGKVQYYLNITDSRTGGPAVVESPFGVVSYPMMYPMGDWSQTNIGKNYTQDDIKKARYTINYRSKPAWHDAVADPVHGQDLEIMAFFKWLGLYEHWFADNVWADKRLRDVFYAEVRASYVDQLKKAHAGGRGSLTVTKAALRQHWKENFFLRKVRCDKKAAVAPTNTTDDTQANDDDEEEEIDVSVDTRASMYEPHTEQVYFAGRVFEKARGKRMVSVLKSPAVHRWHPEQRRLLKPDPKAPDEVWVYNHVPLFNCADPDRMVRPERSELNSGDVVSVRFELGGYTWLDAQV